jgi:hypothetical protein
MPLSPRIAAAMACALAFSPDGKSLAVSGNREVL